jgi:hypothetical protein
MLERDSFWNLGQKLHIDMADCLRWFTVYCHHESFKSYLLFNIETYHLTFVDSGKLKHMPRQDAVSPSFTCLYLYSWLLYTPCETWGFQGSEYEDYCLLKCDILSSDTVLPTIASVPE